MRLVLLLSVPGIVGYSLSGFLSRPWVAVVGFGIGILMGRLIPRPRVPPQTYGAKTVYGGFRFRLKLACFCGVAAYLVYAGIKDCLGLVIGQSGLSVVAAACAGFAGHALVTFLLPYKE